MDKQINPAADAYTYTRDASGKGIVMPDFAGGMEKMAPRNMQSLSPAFKNAPMQAVNAPKGGQPMQQNQEEENAPAYASETFDLDNILDGENLSEDFKERMKVVFEAAVHQKVAAVTEQLTQEANSILEEEIEKVTGQLTEKLDDYLGYVVEEWISENKISLEEGIKVDIAESFLTGLKELFETHYIEIPEGKTELLDKLQERADELETELNTRINENIELSKELVKYQCGMVFLESTDGLTDTQVEKLSSLEDEIEFETVEQYAEKLNILKETYIQQMSNNTNYSRPSRMLAESFEETTTPAAPVSNNMSVYMTAIERQAKKKV